MTKATISAAEQLRPEFQRTYGEAKTYATGSLSDTSVRSQTIGSSSPRMGSEQIQGEFRAPAARHSTPAAAAETEISRIRGVVTRASTDHVEVTFHDPEMQVGFPALLLEGTGLARYGQSVDYIIRQRADGYRYQAFAAAGSSTGENEYARRIQELLSVIDG